MKKKVTLALAAVAAFTVPLSACSPSNTAAESHDHASHAESDAHAEHGDHNPGVDKTAEEAYEKLARLAVSTETGVTVLDYDMTPIDSFDLGGRPTLTTAGDDRHVMAVQGKANKIDVIDGGSWTKPHGDHVHYYRSAPSVADSPIEGTKPTHVVGNDATGVTALYFDGDARALILTPDQLAEDDFSGVELKSSAPHHGVAVPLMNGQVLLSKKGEEMSDSMELLDESNNVLNEFKCPRMHGEVVFENTAIFGCADSILRVDGDKETIIKSPDDSGERVGAIVANQDGSAFLGDWAEDSLLLVKGSEASVIDFPSAFTNRVSLPGGGFAVFGTDGKLRALDNDGKTTKEFNIMDGWTKPEGHGGVMPMMAAGESQATKFVFISEPQNNKVHRINLSADEIESFEVDGTPSSLAVVNGR